MSKALYATIPYLGKGYSVTFKKEGNISNRHLEGYGDLPKEYKDLPIIDFTDNDKVFDFLKLNLRPEDVCFTGNCTLKQYFDNIKNLGITIINY